MKSYVGILIGGLLVVTTANAVAAPQSAPPEAEQDVRLRAELVQIDVVVTDKEGRPVTDLGKEDFLVLEDRQPQEIAFFSFVNRGLPGRPSGGADPPGGLPEADRWLRPSPGRTIVLVIDTLHLSVNSFLRLKKPLMNFVTEHIAAEDQVAIVTTGGGLGILQQFTRDQRMLLEVINRFQFREASRPPLLLRSLDEFRAFLIDREDYGEEIKEYEDLVRHPSAIFRYTVLDAMRTLLSSDSPDDPNRDLAAGTAASMVRQAVQQILAQSSWRVRQTLRTLEHLMRNLSPIPGRKLVVLISDGFLTTGRDFDMFQETNRLADAATRAGVTIYSLDSRGLLAPVPGGDASARGPGVNPIMVPLLGEGVLAESREIETRRTALRMLARATGGLGFFETNDLGGALRRVLTDSAAYYVLAYYPSPVKQDGSFRRIEVNIKDRPDLRVRTRSGYLASPPSHLGEGTKTKEELIQQALGSVLPVTDIPISVSALFLSLGAGKERASVALTNVHIDGRAVGYERAQGRLHASLEVIGFVYDPSGRLVDGFSRTLRLSLRPHRYQQVLREGITYRDHVQLKPGLYNIRVVVLDDAMGRVGAASEWVEIPDLSQRRLALSGILLRGSTVDPARDGQERRKNVGGFLPITYVQRIFPRNATVDFLAFIYNGRSARRLVAEIEVLRSGIPVIAVPPQPVPTDGVRDKTRLSVGKRLSLQDIQPGRYTLKLTVTDAPRRQSVSQEVDFIVR